MLFSLQGLVPSEEVVVPFVEKEALMDPGQQPPQRDTREKGCKIVVAAGKKALSIDEWAGGA